MGYGLEASLPDQKVANFLREANPLIRQGKYDEALSLVTHRVGDIIAADTRVHLAELLIQPGAPGGNQTPSPAPETLSASSTQKAPEQNVKSLIAEGVRYWEQGNYDEAISSFRKVLKFDPKNSVAASGIRKAQKAKADEEKALLESKMKGK